MNATEELQISGGDDLYALFQASFAARLYFFSKVDVGWLGWLWENGFLDVIKEGGVSVSEEDPTPPELAYLWRVAPEDPGLVTDIILGIPVTRTGFTGRMLKNLVWITSRLPAAEFARIAPKVRDEGWVEIMANDGYRQLQHHEAIPALFEAGNHEGLLTFAEALLVVRPKTDMVWPPFSSRGPLCLSDLSCGDLFRCLADIGDSHVERALSLVLRTLGRIVEHRGVRGADGTFGLLDNLFLPDVDFFSVRMGESRVESPDNDAHKLAAALGRLAERHTRLALGNPETLTKFHTENVVPLPDSWAMWRVRLLFCGLAPDTLTTELRNALFKVFASDECLGLAMDAEYLHALGRGFRTLPDSDQREFVRRLCEFTQAGQHHALVGDVLSVISGHLTAGELDAASRLGIKINPDFKPESPADRMEREPRLPRYPMGRDELERFPVPKIAECLKTTWSPVGLEESRDGTRRTPDARGVGDMLAHDIRKRPDTYSAHAALFFDRKRMDPHYTCVYLEGMRWAVEEKPELRAQMNGEGIVDCCMRMVTADKADPLRIDRRSDRGGSASRLGSWQAVRYALAGIMREMLRWTDQPVLLDIAVHRDRIVEIVEHLLSMPDPMLRDMSDDPAWEDPLSLAINSTRGTALDALMLLAHRESKSREGGGKGKIAADVRGLIETPLAKTITKAIMSMYGHHFLALRSLDESWGKGLFGAIFPEDPGKQDFFEAAWRGYLGCAPRVSIHSDPQICDLYKRGMRLSGAIDPVDKRYQDLVERLTDHLARFFVWSPEFGPGHPVMDFLWDQGTPGLRAGFVGEVGMMVFRDDVRPDDALSRKLLRFWDAAIREQQPDDVLKSFGHWINVSSPVIGVSDLAGLVRRTLNATGGELSVSVGLTDSIVEFAGSAPEDTLDIVCAYLSWAGEQGGTAIPFLGAGSGWHKAIRLLSKTPGLNAEVRSLVNDLLATGNPEFECLKGMVPPDPPVSRVFPAQVRPAASRASKRAPV